MRNLRIVAIREYLKFIRNKMFWMVTLAFPALMTVVFGIQMYSNHQVEEQAKRELERASAILVIDQANVVADQVLVEPFNVVSDLDKAKEQVQSGDADALIIYSENILEEKEIKIFVRDAGITSMSRYNDVAQNLIEQSAILDMPERSRQAFNIQYTFDVTMYDSEGEIVDFKLESIIVPLAALVLYFLMTYMGSNFLLMSMSEEKENRMMEILLSIITPKEIVVGKIIGLVGLVMTQAVILGGLGILITWYFLSRTALPIDLSSIIIDPVQVGISLFYVLAGFLTIAAVMVGAGAAAPNYRDAQGMSSIFILLSIFPIYFAMLIMQEPAGTLSVVLSYLPLTSPIVLLARNVLDALPPYEIVISMFVLLGYLGGGFYLAFKLFELGSMEYSEKVDFNKLFKRT